MEFRTIGQRIFARHEQGRKIKEPVQASLFDTKYRLQTFSSENYGLKRHFGSKTQIYTWPILLTKERDLIQTLSELNSFCFDTETTGLNVLVAKLVGIAFSFDDHKGYYVPFPEDDEKAKGVLNEFLKIFGNEKHLKNRAEYKIRYSYSVKLWNEGRRAGFRYHDWALSG